MRTYAEPIIAHPEPASHLQPRIDQVLASTTLGAAPPPPRGGDPGFVEGPPSAFLWRGRHYAVRAVVATWVDQAPWWRDGQAPVRRCWRVEASAGMASGRSVVDLAHDSDGGWHLLAVID